jgi:thymidylate kinase
MSSSSGVTAPRFVVFEGVDGVGKSTLATALTRYYAATMPAVPVYHSSFPGSEPGTLGAWVYRFHHNDAVDAPSPASVAPPALQLLHVAAHVDAITTRLVPAFHHGSTVILDRYWWSTYAYARLHLPPDVAWALVDAERPFWREMPHPIVLYVTRARSLKAYELDAEAHTAIDRAYREVIVEERGQGVQVHDLGNEGPLQETWAALLKILGLPDARMENSV